MIIKRRKHSIAIGLLLLGAIVVLFLTIKPSLVGSHCTIITKEMNFDLENSSCVRAYIKTKNIRFALYATEAASERGLVAELLLWVEIIKDLPEAATVWKQIAELHSKNDQEGLANDAYLQSLTLYQKNDDHENTAAILYQLFRTALRKGDYTQALDRVNQFRNVARQSGNQNLVNKSMLSLAATYYDLGYLKGAEEILDKLAGAISTDDILMRKHLLNNKGTIYLDQGRPALAYKVYQDVLSLSDKDDLVYFLRAIHLNLVDSSSKLGRFAEAEKHMKLAWQLAEPDDKKQAALIFYQSSLHIENKQYTEAIELLNKGLLLDDLSNAWSWELLYLMGQAAEKINNTALALDSYTKSIAILEEIRSELEISDYKYSYLDRQRHPYEALFRLQVLNNDLNGAFITMERAKNKYFWDSVTQINDSQLVKSNNHSNSVDKTIGDAINRIENLQKLRPYISKSSSVNLANINKVISLFKKRSILAYFQTDTELWLTVVNDGNIFIHKIELSREEVAKKIDAFLTDINNQELSRELGQLLLPKITSNLKPKLYLIVDDNLGRLPFAALKINNSFLIEQFVLSHAPDITSMVTLEKSQLSKPYTQAIVIADPLLDLPAAQLEAVNLAKVLNAHAYIGSSATFEALRSASNSSLLHLATHSGTGTEGAWLSIADQKIPASKVITEKIGPKVVVLASCASAAREGKGLWGSLGYAFLTAGSQAVIASLWSIEDNSTARFVEQLYKQEITRDPATALANTQRYFIEQKKEPSFWGVYVLFGSNPNN